MNIFILKWKLDDFLRRQPDEKSSNYLKIALGAMWKAFPVIAGLSLEIGVFWSFRMCSNPTEEIKKFFFPFFIPISSLCVKEYSPSPCWREKEMEFLSDVSPLHEWRGFDE